MKILVVTLLLFTFSCQNSRKSPGYSSHLDSSKVYLIFRGTDSKAGIVAKNFNLFHKQISHVGLGIYEKDSWHIYHVLNTENKDSDLMISDFDSFLSVEDGNVNYLAIYIVSKMKVFERDNLLDQLQTLKTKKIKFDNSFSIDNGENFLYCSEFIVNIFSKIKGSKFQYNPRTIQLNSFQTAYIGRKNLTYYPVDIFLKDNDNLKFIKEYSL